MKSLSIYEIETISGGKAANCASGIAGGAMTGALAGGVAGAKLIGKIPFLVEFSFEIVVAGAAIGLIGGAFAGSAGC